MTKTTLFIQLRAQKHARLVCVFIFNMFLQTLLHSEEGLCYIIYLLTRSQNTVDLDLAELEVKILMSGQLSSTLRPNS